MPTAAVFRRLALSLEGAVEGAHMGHPDFRAANGKIFASLYPGEKSGMVKLTGEQQAELMHAFPDAFMPASGAWGRAGATTVDLGKVETDVLRQALTRAWNNVIAQPAKKKRSTKKARL